MLATPPIRIATRSDALYIAEMSRDYIEFGLPWSWTPARVLHAMREPAANVVVVPHLDCIAGFGIMQYGDDDAHLALLAVHPTRRHQRLGAGLVGWLEQSARVAGLGRIRVEARADNHSAVAFYARLGFRQSGRIAGYYEASIDALQLEKTLYEPAGQP